jgi:hypothetical protein
MTTREIRFRHAAIAYLVYGVLYMAGAIYLASQGIGMERMAGPIIWFVLGTLFIVVFPWLIAKGAQAPGYLWFTRILTLLLAFRAFGVGQVALNPASPTVPLPGGGEVSTALGAWVFFLITLGTMVMLARASWSRQQ